MKRGLTILILFIGLLSHLSSQAITFGFHLNEGYSSTQNKWAFMPYDDATEIHWWDNDVDGYFFQIFVETKFVDIGIEYGKMSFFEFSTGHWGGNYRIDIYYPFTGDYETKRMLGLVQFKLWKNFHAQLGIGSHFHPPTYIAERGSLLGLMTSCRYHIKITDFLEIPIFLRTDYNGVEGKLTTYSMGAGLVVRWKSGLKKLLE